AFIVVFAGAGENETAKSKKRSQKGLKLIGRAWGPTQSDFDRAKARLKKSRAVNNVLAGTTNRMLSFESIERSDSLKFSLEPTHFRALYYDYSNDKIFSATGDFAGREPIEISETNKGFEASATQEEIEAGFKLVPFDPNLGKELKAGTIELFEPMPPVSFVNGVRLVNIGVRYRNSGVARVFGASFKDNRLVDYGKNPPWPSDLGGNCGIADSGQGSTVSGLAGQVLLTVIQEGTTLWEMLVNRPSSSSGSTQRSGVEVRDVMYKGKSVLKRGHAPILNVKYHPGGCGDFRDWQYAEGPFDAPSAGSQNPTDGIRILADGEVAKTIVESGNDTGNFQGVAIYSQNVGLGFEVVLVSEMNAGWYRYIMEWRFAEDGTIRPRYGFGSVTNSCVCRARNHHVYWRFDFDIVQPNNDLYQVERGRRFLQPIDTESKIFRSYQTNRSILIQNSEGNEAYQLTPNITDEEAYNFEGTTLQTYGAGDLWLMRFKGSAGSPDELDDPPGTGSAANLDPWINGESLGGSDAVIWYGAHQYRDDATSLTNFDRSGLVLGGVHTIGPDLRPVRW
ncbi:MAG: hypothetical protein OEM82_13275, partial [Acidobacteriota bacterium]|nr:hypothetical protein [Acidobacteriota bacterium]